MANPGHTVTVRLDAVDEALLGALAAEQDLPVEDLVRALLSGALQGVADAAVEDVDEQSH